MNYLLPLFAIFYLALSGCANSSHSVDDDTNALVTKMTAPQKAGDVVTWIQAKNQPAECKIYSSQPQGDLVIVHEAAWDGQCQSGHAFGTGLEAMTTTQGAGLAIANYVGGQTKPDYYYQTLQEPAMRAFGDPQKGNLILLMQDKNPAVPSVTLITMTQDTDGTRYASMFLPSTGDTGFVKKFPNGYELFYRYSADPQNPVALEIFTRKENVVVGYVVQRYKNGTLAFLKAGANSTRPVQLPDSYLQFLSTTLAQIRQKSAVALQNVEPSVATTMAYKRAACGHPATGTNAGLAALCNEAKDLTRYATLLKALDSEREQRFMQKLQTRKTAGQWLKALGDYNEGTAREFSSLDDAVDQYVESVNRASAMARYLEEGARTETAGRAL